MKRFSLSVVIVLLALATFAATTATAKQPPKPANAKKTNICHFTGKKYVALTVGKSAMWQAGRSPSSARPWRIGAAGND